MSELSKHRSKLKTVVAGSLQVGLVDFAGVLCCPQSAGGAMPEIAGWLEGCGGYVAKYWVDGVLVYLTIRERTKTMLSGWYRRG
jgi:hypothetical protein